MLSVGDESWSLLGSETGAGGGIDAMARRQKAVGALSVPHQRQAGSACKSVITRPT